MFEQRMTLLTLGVADVGRARAFYEALGWRASSVSQSGIAFFSLGGTGLALYPQDELSRDTGLDTPMPGGVTHAYNTRSRDKVETLLAEALAAGGRLLKGANETEWGGYVAYFADLDGHPWEIAYAPMFVPAVDGTIEFPE